ncbi:hypothetical protein [Cerasicoccus maritimus]|uniref:hypothetical protein n=1 Tax=Cerasicoccus maritimus TaxID=490089 RepID=UPI002852B0D4|nr:hypothetical protein [Cerasicoccus maritimus]
MTLKELQQWMLNHDEEDSWWVAVDGEVQDNLASLPDVSKVKEQYPASQISVLHISNADDEDAEWIIFERDPSEFKLAKDKKGGSLKVPHTPTSIPEVVEEEEEYEEEEEPEILEPRTSGGIATSEEFIALQEEVETLKQEVASLKSLAEELKQPIMEAHQVLEEREKFLEISENSLFDKAQKQEVLQTELEQLREELHERERALNHREKAAR